MPDYKFDAAVAVLRKAIAQLSSGVRSKAQREARDELIKLCERVTTDYGA